MGNIAASWRGVVPSGTDIPCPRSMVPQDASGGAVTPPSSPPPGIGVCHALPVRAELGRGK